jgi:hypothetical protein
MNAKVKDAKLKTLLERRIFRLPRVDSREIAVDSTRGRLFNGHLLEPASLSTTFLIAFRCIPSGSKTIRNDRAKKLPLKFPRDDVSHTCSVNYRLFTTEMCSRVKRGRRKQVSYDASRNIKERGTLEPDNRSPVRPPFLKMHLKDAGRSARS